MNHRNALILGLSLCSIVLPLGAVQAQEAGKPTYGHSMQGEAFDEGPRRKAAVQAKIICSRPRCELHNSTGKVPSSASVTRYSYAILA